VKTFGIRKSELDQFFDKKCDEISALMEENCNAISEEQFVLSNKLEAKRAHKKRQEQAEYDKKQKQLLEGAEEVKLNESIDSREENYGEEGDHAPDRDDAAIEQPTKDDSMDALEHQISHAKSDFPQHRWNAKVARYLAYAVDGGILCS